MEPIPGFILYNITEGVKATDLTAWFTRWPVYQNLQCNLTRLEIRSARRPSGWSMEQWILIAVAVFLNVFLVIWPALMGDWYGFAASMSVVALVLVRVWILYDL